MLGKKPHTDPPTEWKISIPTSLALEVMLYLPRDYAKGKVKHGARRDLITSLLREWLTKQRRGEGQGPQGGF
ncbi:MAG: hypothetical protein ACWGQW_20380 [bacterium]